MRSIEREASIIEFEAHVVQTLHRLGWTVEWVNYRDEEGEPFKARLQARKDGQTEIGHII